MVTNVLRKDLRILHNLETAFKDEKERLNSAKDPAHLLYHFGKGIDSALKEILDESSWFLNTLKILGEKINADFEEIENSIKLAEKELEALKKTENVLETIDMESLKPEETEIKKIENNIKGIREAIDQEVRNLFPEGHEQNSLLLKEEELRSVYNYLTELERALKGVQNAIQKVESSTERISNILRSLGNKSFENVNRKLESSKEQINKRIGELREIVEKYYGLFYNLRRDISIKVRNLCQELLQIERQVKTAEKTTATARAS